MIPADVTNAVQEQNIQAAAGKIGQPPNPPGQELEYTVRAKGRLKDPTEYANIILRTNHRRLGRAHLRYRTGRTRSV